ncbi:hypothetical protein [Chelativorans sp. Marseille-P2723]|uniref:hypothetical protein n=1 Tax=Chelativorans sp. Marseille-P2723 TaxID=2709133 RepID=UPI001570C6F1|nr:hypothetical protein [Chelativorans sp. Marseille-P2723]
MEVRVFSTAPSGFQAIGFDNDFRLFPRSGSLRRGLVPNLGTALCVLSHGFNSLKVPSGIEEPSRFGVDVLTLLHKLFQSGCGHALEQMLVVDDEAVAVHRWIRFDSFGNAVVYIYIYRHRLRHCPTSD